MAISIEGFSSDEILALPQGHLDALVLTCRPLVFRAGTAQVLGEFGIQADTLRIDLAHIDGGGEGVLSAIAALAERYARFRKLAKIEWLVRATNCATPNPKLRHVLQRRGFESRDVPLCGECFYKVNMV